jgi:hypothetical protein
MSAVTTAAAMATIAAVSTVTAIAATTMPTIATVAAIAIVATVATVSTGGSLLAIIAVATGGCLLAVVAIAAGRCLLAVIAVAAGRRLLAIVAIATRWVLLSIFAIATRMLRRTRNDGAPLATGSRIIKTDQGNPKTDGTHSQNGWHNQLPRVRHVCTSPVNRSSLRRFRMKQNEPDQLNCQGCCSKQAKWTKAIRNRVCCGALPYIVVNLKAGLAQLVEHLICNQGVRGSSPLAGTIRKPPANFEYCVKTGF